MFCLDIHYLYNQFRISPLVIKLLLISTLGLLFGLLCNPIHAQELDCNVELNYEQLTNAAFNYVAELEPVLETYINEYQWTDEEFLEQEKIECQMQIIFNNGSNDFRFAAEIIITARRPIYNTIQQTNTLIINDQFWNFSYTQGTNLIHDELQFDDLVSFIDFYCHFIVGLDYDTFAQNGGTSSFTKAQNILDTAQSTGSVGWDRNSNNRRNRYWLITDMLNPSYDPYREAIYRYYRFGLDTFTADAINARNEVLEAIKLIRQTRQRTTNTYLFDIFFDAKSKEIASIFSDAETRVRLEAYALLRNTDQSHLSDYESLQN